MALACRSVGVRRDRWSPPFIESLYGGGYIIHTLQLKDNDGWKLDIQSNKFTGVDLEHSHISAWITQPSHPKLYLKTSFSLGCPPSYKCPVNARASGLRSPPPSSRHCHVPSQFSLGHSGSRSHFCQFRHISHNIRLFIRVHLSVAHIRKKSRHLLIFKLEPLSLHWNAQTNIPQRLGRTPHNSNSDYIWVTWMFFYLSTSDEFYNHRTCYW